MNDELNTQISALQRQVFILLVALVCVSGTLTIFLYRQASVAGRDISTIQPRVERLVATFNQDQPVMAKFVEQLVDYGKAHPDFQPILRKYGLVGRPGVTPTNRAVAPAPAVPAK